MYFSCYDEGDLNARKKVLEGMINCLEFLSAGLSIDQTIELSSHFNEKLKELYIKWGNNNDNSG